MEQKYNIICIPGVKPYIPKMRFTRNDSKTCKIEFECRKDAINPMQGILYATITIKDGNGVETMFGDNDIDIVNNIVTFTLPLAAMAEIGMYQGEFKVYAANDLTLTLADFRYYILTDFLSQSITDDERVPVLNNLISRNESVFKNIMNLGVNYQSNAEIAGARYDSVNGKNFANLGARLDNYAEQLEQKEIQIANLKANKAEKVEVVNISNSKADKIYVDNKFSSVGTSSPKGVFATLAALQTAFPSGASGVYLVTGDGGWYFWNSTVWSKGGTYQSSGIADKSILAKHTDFIKISSNIYDDRTRFIGYNISSTTGALVANPLYITSDFIEIKPSTAYSYKGFLNVAYYDVNKQFISRPYLAYAGETLTSPSNAYYIRVHFETHSLATYSRQINEGSALLTYENYYKKLDKEYIEIDSLVSPQGTTFFSTSNNLFDLANIIKGYVVLNGGSLSANSDYNVSFFIEASENKKYTELKCLRITFYNKNKEYLGEINDPDHDSGNPFTFTTPPFTKYVRVTVQNNKLATAQLNLGESLLPYENWYSYINRTNLFVTPKETSFFDISTNLFDKKNSIVGYALTSGLATPIVNINYTISDFIPITQRDYTFIGINRVTFYNSKKQYISDITRVDYNPRTVIPPSDAAYVRLSVQNTELDTAQFNEGSSLLPYRDGTPKLKKDLYKLEDQFRIDVPVDGVFNTNDVFSGYTDMYTRTASQAYAMWDSLMASYPNYITRQLLGNEATGLPIYAYYLNPSLPTSDKSSKMIKVFLTCGTHGIEKASTLSTYLMVKQMCEKWTTNPLLEVLRFNVKFIIIPVVNPWGWNNGDRRNSRGVDINRNFPYQWIQGTSGTQTYGGSAPLSELEAQYVKKVFDDNPDINIMYDFHNFFKAGTEPDTNFIWIPTNAGVRVQHLAQNLISRLTRKWSKDYSFVTDFVGYTSTVGDGMIQNYANSLGIKYSATFEVRDGIKLDPNGQPYDPTMCKFGVEAITNWLLLNIKDLVSSQ